MNYKKTLSIGIPVFNESGNIIQLLETILKQRQHTYTLEHVYVMCDGGTDDTAIKVSDFSKQHANVKCMNDGKNKGKISRLNQLFSINASDILVLFDGDVRLHNPDVLDSLVDSFSNEKIGIVGGHDVPVKATNFFGNIVTTTIDLWYATRKDIHHGDTVHNLHGCIMAISKRCSEQITIPPKVISDDEYLYFAAKKAGFHFHFASNAYVYYKAPRNFMEYMKQSARFIGTEQKIIQEFGKGTEDSYIVPRKNKINGIITTFLHNPFYTPFALMLQILLRMLMPYFQDNYENNTWTSVRSTK